VQWPVSELALITKITSGKTKTSEENKTKDKNIAIRSGKKV
jgi:hypothetical protein